MMGSIEAIVVPNHGTIVMRADGSVMIVDRSRTRYYIDAAIVEALRGLLIRQDDGSSSWPL